MRIYIESGNGKRDGYQILAGLIPQCVTDSINTSTVYFERSILFCE